MNIELTRQAYLLMELGQTLTRCLLLTQQIVMHGGDVTESGHRLTNSRRLECELNDLSAIKILLQRMDTLAITQPRDYDTAVFDKMARLEKATREREIVQ